MKLKLSRWTLAVSWGPSGGFYLHRHRVCLWRLAFTAIPEIEIDELMKSYIEIERLREALRFFADRGFAVAREALGEKP